MESFVVIAILLAVYWIVGFIIFKLFKKEIRNEKGYLACIIGGFILKRALISSMGWNEKTLINFSFSFISGKNAAYGFGAIFTPYVITIINSLFRNKFKFKKTFDDKFYPFFMGLLGFAFISTTLSAIF